MSFITDKQTVDDLAIFTRVGGKSVYGVYNRTITNGGSLILEEMFRNPMSDIDKIEARAKIIEFFKHNKIDFPFRVELFDTIEFYLKNNDSRTRITIHEDNLERKFKRTIGGDSDYQQLQKGVLAVTETLSTFNKFVTHLESIEVDEVYREQVEEMRQLLSLDDFKEPLQEKSFKRFSYAKIASYDQNYRFNNRETLQKLLSHVYSLDVYISVARVAQEKGFVTATAYPPGSNKLEMEGIFHPLLDKAIPNSISVDDKNNMIFLTGANMAGKSTFMKSFGIAIYLAHMGFPLPAKKLSFTVQDGMFTTINLADNLNIGYSHFYSEVMRVKKVAESLRGEKSFVVIFDELFRGTNVKDAFDATVAVVEAFATNKNSTFIISTHIIEAGETLRDLCDNINFVYLPTVMDGDIPRYTYQLAEGITSDRHGMVIITNEGILDILSKGVSKEKELSQKEGGAV